MSNITWPDYRTIDFQLKPRHEQRRLIRVVVNTDRQSVGGNLCTRGTHFVLIYVRDLEHLSKLAVSAGDRVVLATAEAGIAKKFEEWRKKYATEEKAKATFGESVAAAFYELTGRGIPPFEEFDVHPDIVPPPDSPEARVEGQTHSNEQMMAMMAEAVTQLVKRDAQRGDQRK